MSEFSDSLLAGRRSSGRTLPTLTSASYRAVGIALAVAGVIAFSFRPILIKLAYSYVRDPVTLIALRMLFSAPSFAAAALAGKRAQDRVFSMHIARTI